MSEYRKPPSAIGPVGWCVACEEDGPCEFHCMRCGEVVGGYVGYAGDIYEIRHWVPDLGEWQQVSQFCGPCWATM